MSITIEVSRPVEILQNGKKTRLAPGTHVITEDDMGAWYMPGLIKSGAIALKEAKSKSKSPVKPLMYGDVKITLGESGKMSVSGANAAIEKPGVAEQPAEQEPAFVKPDKTKLRRP